MQSFFFNKTIAHQRTYIYMYKYRKLSLRSSTSSLKKSAYLMTWRYMMYSHFQIHVQCSMFFSVSWPGELPNSTLMHILSWFLGNDHVYGFYFTHHTFSMSFGHSSRHQTPFTIPIPSRVSGSLWKVACPTHFSSALLSGGWNILKNDMQNNCRR